MKAIEILFNEINDIHTKIVATDNINDKITYLSEMKSVIEIINQIAIHHFDYQSKDYL